MLAPIKGNRWQLKRKNNEEEHKLSENLEKSSITILE